MTDKDRRTDDRPLSGGSEPAEHVVRPPSSVVRCPLLQEQERDIAILTLNRAQARNSLSEALLGALGDALAAIAADASLRVVVLAANGPVFSAGHDLKELTARRSDRDRGRGYFEHVMTVCSAVMQQIVHLPQPVIVAVQGPAIAAGCQLVASCDLALASSGATF